MSKGTMSTPATQTPMTGTVPHEKIAKRAYEKWCMRGCPHGSHQQDWLEAEMELKAEMMGGGKVLQSPPPVAARAQTTTPTTTQKAASRR
jgi:hypothetical protein